MTTVRGRKIVRRTVISLNEAAEVGVIHNIVFDRQAGMAALVIRRRASKRELATTDIENMHSLGRDAITIKDSEQVEGNERLEALSALPNLHQLVGCRMVTEGGTFIGVVRDVVVDPVGRRITDFVLSGRGVLGRLRGDVIPATGHLRFGKTLVIVPNTMALKGKARLERIEEPAQPVVLVEVARGVVDLPRRAEPVVSRLEEKAANGDEEGIARAVGG